MRNGNRGAVHRHRQAKLTLCQSQQKRLLTYTGEQPLSRKIGKLYEKHINKSKGQALLSYAEYH